MAPISISSPAFADEAEEVRYLVFFHLKNLGSRICDLLFVDRVFKKKIKIRLYGYDLQNWIQTSQINSASSASSSPSSSFSTRTKRFSIFAKSKSPTATSCIKLNIIFHNFRYQ